VEQLHVISWNLHGVPTVAPMETRLARVAEQISLRGPDLVLFQEVWFEGDARTLDSLLGPGYSRVEDSWAVNLSLLSALSGFRRGGLLTYVRKEDAGGWKASRSEFRRFDRSPPWYHRPFDEGDGLSAKGIQYFRLERSGDQLIVFNTHLQSQYPKDTYGDARIAQIAQLQELASTFPRQELILVAGDFNTWPDESEIYGLIIKSWQDKAPWHDLTAPFRLENKDAVTHLEPDERPAHWIDYVLLRAPSERAIDPRLRLLKSRSIDCPYSDHHGLEALITIGAM
jgi:endonuclease/exonuclease/phosphatase family metal-dependent hydrolase